MPTHAEKQILPYQPEQLFDLVIDCAKYPEFLPWCVAVRVRSRADHEVIADMTIGYGPFRESFTTRATPHRPDRIDVRYEKGPFKYLNNHWSFLPHPNGTEVGFFIDFEFNSRILQTAISMVFNEAVRRMVTAFHKRAIAVYGPPQSPVPQPPGANQPKA
jgi:coenzyme Q-binding protein COQ10